MRPTEAPDAPEAKYRSSPDEDGGLADAQEPHLQQPSKGEVSNQLLNKFPIGSTLTNKLEGCQSQLPQPFPCDCVSIARCNLVSWKAMLIQAHTQQWWVICPCGFFLSLECLLLCWMSCGCSGCVQEEWSPGQSMPLPESRSDGMEPSTVGLPAGT